MEPIIGGGPDAVATVKDSNTENFVADVLEASKKIAVVVDFWAPWCGPCKQLGPQIEQAVAARSDKVTLVKINVDENQEIAAQFQIQSIPAVYAFKDGKPVDGFVGALPESQIKAFVDRVAGETGPSPIDTAVEQAAVALEAGDYTQASTIYQQVISHDPVNAAAIGGLIRCHVGSGKLGEARAQLEATQTELLDHADISGAKAALELAEETETSGENNDLAALQSTLHDTPNNHQARYDLACALWANNQREEAMDELLEIVRLEPKWNEEAARKQLLKYFEAIGLTDPLAVEARGRLSSLLFA